MTVDSLTNNALYADVTKEYEKIINDLITSLPIKKAIPMLKRLEKHELTRTDLLDVHGLLRDTPYYQTTPGMISLYEKLVTYFKF